MPVSLSPHTHTTEKNPKRQTKQSSNGPNATPKGQRPTTILPTPTRKQVPNSAEAPADKKGTMRPTLLVRTADQDELTRKVSETKSLRGRKVRRTTIKSHVCITIVALVAPSFDRDQLMAVETHIGLTLDAHYARDSAEFVCAAMSGPFFPTVGLRASSAKIPSSSFFLSTRVDGIRADRPTTAL